MRTPLLIAALALSVSCGGKSSDKDGTKSDDPPAWERGKPTIDSRDLVPGYPYNLDVAGLPEGGPVRWFTSEVGPGMGECLDRWESVCVDLEQATELAQSVADGEGTARYSWDVPQTEPPRVVWFQAVAEDPANGALAKTSVLQRHVAVPPQLAAVSFHIVDLDAGVDVATAGNSHTGGSAWVDVNGDYLADLFITNSTDKGHRLFLNNGDGTFRDWSARVQKPIVAIEDAGVAFADVDNDGDEDILVVADSPRPMNVEVPQEKEGGPNMLYLNNGDGSFTESAEAWGVVDPRGWRTSCGTFGDYDRDGKIDLYLCNWAMLSEPSGVYDNTDRLLHNTGTSFAPATQTVDGHGRDALVARMVDLDQDLWPDLYVGNVAEEFDPPVHDPRDVLYKNESGTFVDRTDGQMGNGEDAWAAMGTTLGDIDNDGLWEFYVTDHWDYPPEPRGNALYRVGSDGQLSDNVCDEAGVCAGYLTWPANFADFDQDGWVDLWVGTAWGTHNDLVFINRRDGVFDLHAQENMAANATHGGSVADYDADGDLDIFLFSDIGRSHLYANDVATSKHWLAIKLVGTDSNRSAIGAVIRATNGLTDMMRMVSGGDSAHSQSDLVQHFGLGPQPGAEVQVTWPSGKVQDIGPMYGDRFYVIDEDAGVLDEVVSGITAAHDVAAGTLTVTATSNYRGRTRLVVEPMNQPMVYDAELQVHRAVLVADPYLPIEISVESERGGSWNQAIVAN